MTVQSKSPRALSPSTSSLTGRPKWRSQKDLRQALPRLHLSEVRNAELAPPGFERAPDALAPSSNPIHAATWGSGRAHPAGRNNDDQRFINGSAACAEFCRHVLPSLSGPLGCLVAWLLGCLVAWLLGWWGGGLPTKPGWAGRTAPSSDPFPTLTVAISHSVVGATSAVTRK
jgi:hypothetical protein